MTQKILNRILVPYDGSRHSKKALSTAMEITNKLNSKIFLFTVVSQDYIRPPGALLGLVGQSSKSISQKLLSNAKKRAIENIRKEISHYKRKNAIEYSIDVGNVSEKILKFSKKKKITLIIIGSKGLYGLNVVKALGSTSRKISEYAHCPVLIIR